MPNRRFLFLLSLALLIIAASILLFYGGPGAYASRSTKELWNLGHVIYFALLVVLVSKVMKGLGVSTAWIWIVSILLTLVWGVAIELIQQGGDRSAEIMDVFRDLVGALLALVLMPGSMQLFRRGLRRFIRLVVYGFLMISLVPLLVSVSDEVIAAAQFPVLSNFETPFELDRWTGKAEFAVVEAAGGSASPTMRIALSTQEIYTGVGMQYLVPDWRDYEFLNLDIYYPQESPLRLSLKVFDAAHRTVEPTYLYHDRFNRSYQLQTGWNHIQVPLHEIRASPQNREMDISRIAGLQLFAARLKQPKTIFLDRVYLSER